MTFIYSALYIRAVAQENPTLFPHLFEGTTFRGKAEDLFGKEGEIVKAGHYYSLNRGKTSQGQQLVVLDMKQKSLKGYYFSDSDTYMQHEVGEWNSTRFLFETMMSNTSWIKPDTLFFLANEFISKMRTTLPKLDKKEASKVEDALNEAVQPLLAHFKEKKRHIDFIVKQLSEV